MNFEPILGPILVWLGDCTPWMAWGDLRGFLRALQGRNEGLVPVVDTFYPKDGLLQKICGIFIWGIFPCRAKTTVRGWAF